MLRLLEPIFLQYSLACKYTLPSSCDDPASLTGTGFRVPPNLHFFIEDAESDWGYNHKFDFVHARMMAGSFKDYPAFFKKCFANVRPGGYLEMQDIQYTIRSDDDTVTPSTPLLKWGELMIQAYRKLGHVAESAISYKQQMEEAGFVDVVEVVHKWPSNTWPKDPEHKEIGMWNYMNILQGLQGFTMAPFTRGLGWSPAQVEVFLVDVRKDLKDRKIHAYWPIHFVYGRKPEN